MNVRTVEVKDIKWYTDSIGKVKPVISLIKSYKISSGKTFDGLALESPDVINEMKIGTGKKLKIKVSDNALKITKNKISQKNKIKKFDTAVEKCPACGSDVENFMCVNRWCFAKAKTPLYRLLRYTIPAITFEQMDAYLDSFKVYQSDEPVKIENIVQLLWVFNIIKKSINTTGRAGCLSHPTHNKLEMELLKKLEEGLKNNEFWTLIGVKSMSEEDLFKLSDVSYWLMESDSKKFDATLHEKFDIKSKDLIEDILRNESGIVKLIKMLKQFKC